MTVRYMPHMPELEGVSGKARYEGDALHFDVASGTAVGLRTSGATIDLTDLLEAGAVRSAPSADRRIGAERRPLPRPPAARALAEMLYDYRRVGGDATIDLSLSFPLLNSVTLAKLDIKAEASVASFR